jgi:prepilin-type N-terminal cleavage/methylation domain-containing protein
MRPSSPRARLGFTLVELLVVISIIAVLVALLLVAVTGVFNTGTEAITLNDLSQLTIGVDNFKAKFNGLLPPSKITLSHNQASMDPTSVAYVNALWPRIEFNNDASPLDWAGTGLAGGQLRNITYVLEGDQCLVFFLGGIPLLDPHNPTVKGCQGFSSNPKNPTYLPRTDAERSLDARLSFMQFDNSRLFVRDAQWYAARKAEGKPYLAAPSPVFYSYKDSWSTEMPYVYFSAGKRANGYNPAPGDCPSLMRLGPYFEPGASPTRYINPARFQIISAGKNGWFGPGGPWSPATAASIGEQVAVGGVSINTGGDDQANFYGSKLGVPQ